RTVRACTRSRYGAYTRSPLSSSPTTSTAWSRASAAASGAARTTAFPARSWTSSVTRGRPPRGAGARSGTGRRRPPGPRHLLEEGAVPAHRALVRARLPAEVRRVHRPGAVLLLVHVHAALHHRAHRGHV